MASGENQETSQENNTEPKAEDLPLVLVHRLPIFDLPSKDRDHLKTHFCILDPSESHEPIQSFLSSHAQSVRALLSIGPAPINREILDLLPSLELIVCSSAGFNHVDMSECRCRGITITNASAAFCEDVADYAITLLIDVLRRISAGDRYVRSGSWPQKGDYPLGFKAGRKRVGIVGLGCIGSEVAKRLVPFGCSIAYTSRKQKPSVPFSYYANVRDLAANSNVLILCCALTEETHHIINKDVMTALGKEGVIINVGRGALIDEKELVQCLLRGDIGGAGMDVFENEPNVPSEFFALDNVVLSLHLAGGTQESFAALRELTLTNLKAFFSNKPLISVVQNE